MRVWHALWLERINRKIAHLRQRQADEERGRRTRPQPPDWLVELHTATREPLQVHGGQCGMTGRSHRPVSRDEAAASSPPRQCRPARSAAPTPSCTSSATY
ncbi:DUF6233 domain-containing protein [Streptomyces sp. NPDC101152]|uniref:DUF6233 domain-containing protein n=1 Tax=Streptomyces sp. NPDC101152 TaxID=3366116 RepID=UPI00380E15D6